MAESGRGRFFSIVPFVEAVFAVDRFVPFNVDGSPGDAESVVPARRSFISRSTSSIVRLSFFCKFNFRRSPCLNAA